MGNGPGAPNDPPRPGGGVAVAPERVGPQGVGVGVEGGAEDGGLEPPRGGEVAAALVDVVDGTAGVELHAVAKAKAGRGGAKARGFTCAPSWSQLTKMLAESRSIDVVRDRSTPLRRTLAWT